MCSDCKKSDLTLLDGIIYEIGTDSGSLITVLQRAQEVYGYLPTDVMYAVPSDSTIRKVIITPDCVKNGTGPEIIRTTD